MEVLESKSTITCTAGERKREGAWPTADSAWPWAERGEPTNSAPCQIVTLLMCSRRNIECNVTPFTVTVKKAAQLLARPR